MQEVPGVDLFVARKMVARRSRTLEILFQGTNGQPGLGSTVTQVVASDHGSSVQLMVPDVTTGVRVEGLPTSCFS